MYLTFSLIYHVLQCNNILASTIPREKSFNVVFFSSICNYNVYFITFILHNSVARKKRKDN